MSFWLSKGYQHSDRLSSSLYRLFSLPRHGSFRVAPIGQAGNAPPFMKLRKSFSFLVVTRDTSTLTHLTRICSADLPDSRTTDLGNNSITAVLITDHLELSDIVFSVALRRRWLLCDRACQFPIQPNLPVKMGFGYCWLCLYQGRWSTAFGCILLKGVSRARLRLPFRLSLLQCSPFQPNQPFEMDLGYHLGYVSVTVSVALFHRTSQSRRLRLPFRLCVSYSRCFSYSPLISTPSL